MEAFSGAAAAPYPTLSLYIKVTLRVIVLNQTTLYIEGQSIIVLGTYIYFLRCDASRVCVYYMLPDGMYVSHVADQGRITHKKTVMGTGRETVANTPTPTIFYLFIYF